jgi:hypothetical protein
MTLFAFKCLYPTGEAQHILHFLVLYSCLCIRLLLFKLIVVSIIKGHFTTTLDLCKQVTVWGLQLICCKGLASGYK